MLLLKDGFDFEDTDCDSLRQHNSGGRSFRGSRSWHLGRRLFSTMPLIGALMLPKCPVCLAAWAATVGMGAVGSRLLVKIADPHLRLILLVILISPLCLRMVLGASVILCQPRLHPSDHVAPADPSPDPTVQAHGTHSPASGD